MKNPLSILLILLTSLTLTSCEAIGDIFGAGVSVGIFLVLFVIVIVAVIVIKMLRRK